MSNAVQTFGPVLAGKLALVTGAGQGIGAELAKALACAGARVVVTDINLSAATTVAEEIQSSGGESWAFAHDVSDRVGTSRLAASVAAIGDLSILVNNAGVCLRALMDDENAVSDWEKTQRINVDGPFNMLMAFRTPLRKTRGSVINLGSIQSFVAYRNGLSYATSKGAIRMLTQAAAIELGGDGVRVNAVCPGVMATPINETMRNDPQRSQDWLKRIPLGRFGEPKEIAGAVIFLASEMASYITGTTLVVDGGYLAN